MYVHLLFRRYESIRWPAMEPSICWRLCQTGKVTLCTFPPRFASVAKGARCSVLDQTWSSLSFSMLSFYMWTEAEPLFATPNGFALQSHYLSPSPTYRASCDLPSCRTTLFLMLSGPIAVFPWRSPYPKYARLWFSSFSFLFHLLYVISCCMLSFFRLLTTSSRVYLL